MSESRVKVENISNSKVKLTIKVSAEEFDKALDMAFEKVIKKVKIDGFREGKAPKNVFINHYGWESLYQDGIEYALQLTYYPAVQKVNIIPVSDPKIDLDFSKIKKGSGFTYTAEIEIWPTPELGQYKGLTVKAKSTRVTKKMVEDYIKEQLKNKAEIVVKDTPATLGDTVVIDFEGFVNGEAFEGGKAENYPLELGSHAFVPGFEDQLVGTKTGDELDVNVVFPENYHESLASKPATFKVKVHEVKGREEAELNDDLVAEMEIEGVKTVKEYNEYVKKLLQNQKEQENENYIMDTLMKKIEKGSKIVVPQAVVDEELNKQVERIENQAKQYKVPTEVLLQYSGYANMEAYKKAGAEYIKRQITEEVIIEEIVKAEKFEVSKEEIEAEYAKLCGDKPEETEADKAKRLEDVKKKFSAEQVEHHLKMTKAVNLIKDSAVIE